jgi:hypothetical protein
LTIELAMREIAQFRIPEEKAKRFLRPEDGVVLGTTVRKLQVDTRDSLYARIGELNKQFNEQGSTFFLGWDLQRKYTKAELKAAELFQLQIRPLLQSAGELCGTQYDDAAGCPHCGAGAPQLNELRLDPGRISRSKDMNRTIAQNEVIFSSRLVAALREHNITGARFHPILRKGGKSALDTWFQLEVCSRPVEMAAPTRCGNNPFDDDEKNEYRCPKGHVVGLNLLSEVWVKRESYDGSDLCATRQLVGMRSRNDGLFRPHPVIFISPRLQQLLEELGARGYELEVAYFV